MVRQSRSAVQSSEITTYYGPITAPRPDPWASAGASQKHRSPGARVIVVCPYSTCQSAKNAGKSAARNDEMIRRRGIHRVESYDGSVFCRCSAIGAGAQCSHVDLSRIGTCFGVSCTSPQRLILAEPGDQRLGSLE